MNTRARMDHAIGPRDMERSCIQHTSQSSTGSGSTPSALSRRPVTSARHHFGLGTLTLNAQSAKDVTSNIEMPSCR